MCKEQETAKIMSNAVNGSFNCKEFARYMNHEHPTLQQSFTNVCLEWLRFLANAEENKAWIDGRNECAVKAAKRLKPMLYDEKYPDYPVRLPLI